MELSIRELKQAVRLAEKREKARGRVGQIETQLARVLHAANGKGDSGNASNGVVKAKAKPHKRVTPAVVARRRSQGKYLAALRPLSPRQRLAVRAVYQEDGMRAALTAAKKAATV